MAKDLNVSRLCDIYGMLLTEHRREIVREFYDYDLSLAEIAENFGITRQAVLCNIKQAESKLCEYEKALGIAEKTDKLAGELRAVLDVLPNGAADVRARLLTIIDDLQR